MSGPAMAPASEVTYEQWWWGFIAEHEDWRLADSDALRRAAFEFGKAAGRQQVEVLQHEVNAARESKERTLRILMGIHALLHPPIFTDRDGKMWQFKSPIIKEQMQALSDRIRAIPEEIDAIAATQREAIAEYIDRNLMSCGEYADAIPAGEPK